MPEIAPSPTVCSFAVVTSVATMGFPKAPADALAGAQEAEPATAPADTGKIEAAAASGDVSLATQDSDFEEEDKDEP